jgi:hypothetical protein
MKKTNIKLWAGALLMLFVTSSCEDNLDINENPNSAVSADVQLVLPQAITASANIANQFNSYGGHFGGFIANAGGFSGFGSLLNYNLQPGDYNGLWVNTYQDPLQDLKYVIDNTEGDASLAYYNAAAKIMSVVNFQRLVDAFGNIPYSEALRGSEGITAPKYDDAATIYQDLYATLDEAIATINAGLASETVVPLRLTAATDPLFSEFATLDVSTHMDAWKRYANSLKLRMLIRLSGKTEFSSFVTQGFATLDPNFITNDVIVDPGYDVNKPNPEWATWGKTTAGALANSSRIPTTFAFGFYNGQKITDRARGEMTFVNYPTTPTNQLGNEVGNPTIVTGLVTWASNQGASGSSPSFIGTGVLKGPAMGQPLMLAAESRFLEAEAQLKGFLAGDYVASFNAGITASFNYLLKTEAETTVAAPAGFVTTYKADNAGNRLVDITLATTDAQRLEAIITQKYIAMNMITSDEAFNEYRRTGYPVSQPGGAPAFDIASNKSTATARPDRLPTRILYPSSEQAYNSSNFLVVNPFGDLLFWDPN